MNIYLITIEIEILRLPYNVSEVTLQKFNSNKFNDSILKKRNSH